MNLHRSRRFLSLLLTLAMVASLLVTPLAAFAEEGDGIALQAHDIPLATGNPIATPRVTGPYFNIVDYGAVSNNDAASTTVGVTNQDAIQAAINFAHAAGGGTVVVPSGNFRTYTIYLKDNVTLYLESEDSVLQAARSSLPRSGDDPKVPNDGGNYDAPEPFFYAKLQDQGHSHYKNSMIVAYGAENVMIAGPGLIDGSWVNDQGQIVNELSGSDVGAADDRTTPTNTRESIANKAIALYDSKNVFLQDIRILNGGHFAIIAEGVVNMTVDNVLVDTNRDAFNIDCSQNVTVTNSVFNSLTDDAIVLKADFGMGYYMRTENVLIDNCTVSGYDAGSVLYRTFTTDKLVATDACGPTARIKLGTEGTGGFDTITINNVTFDRSRGFAMEAVDSADLTNIVMTNCTMNNVSSSPIFIRVGDRSRAPVTSTHTTTAMANAGSIPAASQIRLDNSPDWVLPTMTDKVLYPDYPVNRYVPSYNRSGNSVVVDQSSTNGSTYADISVPVVHGTNPARINQVNLDILEAADEYRPALQPGEDGYQHPGLFANAVGGFESRIAEVRNVYIGNVEITNVDPRYPITLAGLMDGKIYNVTLENISVQYRGGLTMLDAVEQRQIHTQWAYTQYKTAPGTQAPPWLRNEFFTKQEANLPRLSWNEDDGVWDEDPYNIPERPREYPEPSNFGILPAWGLWARHVEGLTLNNVNFEYMVPDTRDAIVLDDVDDVAITNCTADGDDPVVTAVTNNYKRPTNLEYIPNTPYEPTTVTDLTITGGNLTRNNVTVDAPEPGTPRDDEYEYMTHPVDSDPAGGSRNYSYRLAVQSNASNYSLPLTVYRPYFTALTDKTVRPGDTLTFDVAVRDPAVSMGASGNPATYNGIIINYRREGHYLEQFAEDDSIALRDIAASGTLPDGATVVPKAITPTPGDPRLDPERAATFTWDVPEDQAEGAYPITFMVTDGLIPVEKTVIVYVGAPAVTSFSPSGGNVSLYANSFTITFDREMTKEVGTVSVGGAVLSNPVWSWDGTSVTYTMAASFSQQAVYTVAISGFEDIGGVEMTPYTGQFTTESIPSYPSTPSTPAPKGTTTTQEPNEDGTIDIEILVDGKPITKPLDEPVLVTVPVEELAPNSVVYIVNEDGTETPIIFAKTADGKVLLMLSNSATIVVREVKSDFTDMGGHWSLNEVLFLYGRKLFIGISETEFAPDATVTLATLPQVLYRMAGEPKLGEGDVYPDIQADMWYSNAMNWFGGNIMSAGLAEDITERSPDDVVSTEILMTMLHSYAMKAGLVTADEEFIVPAGKYGDNQVSDFAETAMAWAVSKGILIGNEHGIVIPDATVTRAVLVTIVARFIAMQVA